ncbi:MAG: extracellular solute-binding protein [Ruminococcaceae bacterium]|nr:extracellular solute-binding protein [Oscillospiraceae bacterium]
MMRKYISLLLALAMLFTCFTAGFGASAASADNEQRFVITGSEEYVEYQKNFTGNETIPAEIVLDSKNASAQGTGVSVEADGVALTKTGDSLTWTFSVPQDGWYEPTLTYCTMSGNGNDIEMKFLLDGAVPYPEIETNIFPRIWKNLVEEFQVDNDGNQYSPEQVEAFDWQTMAFIDDEGFGVDNLKLFLTAGTHTIKLTLNGELLKVGKLVLGQPTGYITYEDYAKQFEKKNYDGDIIIYEGEKADYKSQKMFIPLSSRNEAVVYPSDPHRTKMNYVGGSNWNDIGGTITWELEVPEDAFYQLDLHFRQNVLQESNSYRTLLVDGEIPFAEAKEVAFPYKSGWQYMSLTDENGEAMPIYLTAGKHTISLRVTLGKLSSFAYGLRQITDRLGKIYRKIVRITGESPDANRDYEIFTAVPELEDELTDISQQLEELALESERIAGAKGGTSAQTLRKANITINQMLKVKYEAHQRLSAYYDNYSSLSSWLYEMQSMVLDVDSIALASVGSDVKYRNVNFFEDLWFGIRRLFSTFINDYQHKKQNDNTLTLWSNWGRDQITILENLIANDFTPKTGIKVDLKITAASLIHAGLSNTGPDLSINEGSANVINYAMRGIVEDISGYENFDKLLERFPNNAVVPYQYRGGVYALPNTETFAMMFIRTDIFEELGLEVPTTWEECINCAKVIALNNMDVGVAADAYTFMVQNDVPIYADDLMSTNLMSTGAVDAVRKWTDFYTKYNFPKTFDFFNRFRTGLMPMGITAYTTYSTIKAAAPEINGRWEMYEIPGTVREDGTVNNTVIGAGTGAMILKWSELKDEAWQFIDWWTSEDIQYRFGVNCEAVLGVSGRYASANLEAVYKFGWDEQNLNSLKGQLTHIDHMPEVPGSYYLSRSMQQVYWNVVNMGEDVEDMLNKWIPEADDEIRRKTEEYIKD